MLEDRLEDNLENQHIKCKIIRRNVNISIECELKEDTLDNEVYYYAANTPDRLTTFSGSGLPFPTRDMAFEGSPNIGRKVLNNGNKKFILNLLRPNSYYNEDYLIVEPEVIIKYLLKNKKTRVINIPIDNKIPHRFLLMNKKDEKDKLKIETQEKKLLRNQYPNILI
tara:strand:- start:448 stop:948 length:501 start_codon:yes stop_codon:yes gene_type:complete